MFHQSSSSCLASLGSFPFFFLFENSCFRELIYLLYLRKSLSLRARSSFVQFDFSPSVSPLLKSSSDFSTVSSVITSQNNTHEYDQNVKIIVHILKFVTLLHKNVRGCFGNYEIVNVYLKLFICIINMRYRTAYLVQNNHLSI